MAKIIGTPTVTPVPKTDFLQTDPTKADYLKGREHIATKEEWITIADTILEEEVASLEFTTDRNGNPFECKKIVAQIINNGKIATNTYIYFGAKAEIRATLKATDGMICIVDVVDGIFTEYKVENYAYSTVRQTDYGGLHTIAFNQKNLKKFVLTSSASFLSGVRIVIWGLKA